MANGIKTPMNVRKRAKLIQVLLMDVDGTMTDGSVTLLSQSDGTALEIKTFDAITMVRGPYAGRAHCGHTPCTDAAKPDVQSALQLLRRAKEMKMDFVYQKQPVKIPAFEEIVKLAGVPESAVAYVGDDLPDLPVMRRVGLAIAVGDAVPEVKAAAHHVVKARAGRGAIRETVELILKSKGIWKEMIDKAVA